MKSNKKLSDLLKKLPSTPGVYKMKGIKDEIIYIGKAKNLKNRVTSYFKKTDKQSIKTQKLVEKIEDIEWIETNSELEALILETNYIKENRPKFNVLMKDDKNYVYAKVTVNEDFPKIEIVRKIEKDGSKYFGPKTSSIKLHSSIEFLYKIYQLRNCKLEITSTNSGIICKGHEKYPCLEYQLKRCIGPCIGEISKEEYHEYIKKVIAFFEGKYLEVIEDIQKRMIETANKKLFEHAAKYRDLMKTVKDLHEKQIVSDVSMESRDIIGIFHDLGKTFIALFQVRIGKIISNENYILENEGEYDEMIQAFLTGYYEKASNLPNEILLPQELSEKNSLELWFKKTLQINMKIIFPKKGKRGNLIELAMNNAKSFAESHRARWMSDNIRKEEAKNNIIKLINNNIDSYTQYEFPKRMECFDVSHYGGESTVASMAVFIDGEEEKKEYRRYKIKTMSEGDIDDYKALSEVITRRLAEIENSLSMKEFLEDEEKYEIRKLNKKEIIEYKLFKIPKHKKNCKTEKIDLNIYYAMFEKKTLKYFVELKKHNWKLYEILNECKKTKDKNIQKIFYKKLYKEFEGKDLWILTEDIKTYEVFGFKKLKTLEKNWQQEPGLVPKEITQSSKTEKGYALKIRIPKKGFDQTSIPNLILIDGGKGQLASVSKIFKKNDWIYSNNAFNKNDISIIICSIAKKNEFIFFPNEQEERTFKNTCEGSYLLQRLRDEAHRFAVEYNRQKRIKKTFMPAIKKLLT